MVCTNYTCNSRSASSGFACNLKIIRPQNSSIAIDKNLKKSTNCGDAAPKSANGSSTGA